MSTNYWSEQPFESEDSVFVDICDQSVNELWHRPHRLRQLYCSFLMHRNVEEVRHKRRQPIVSSYVNEAQCQWNKTRKMLKNDHVWHLWPAMSIHCNRNDVDRQSRAILTHRNFNKLRGGQLKPTFFSMDRNVFKVGQIRLKRYPTTTLPYFDAPQCH